MSIVKNIYKYRGPNKTRYKKGTKYSNLINEIDADINDEALKNIVYIVENEDYTDENLKNLFDNLFVGITSTDYIDNSYLYLKHRHKEDSYDGILGTCYKYLKTKPEMEEKADEIFLSSKDTKYQYDIHYNSEYSRSELLANMMNLSNIMAHMLIDNRRNINFETKPYIDSLYKLKDFCIEELLKCKDNGENLEIQLKETENGNIVFYAVIPEYFEPFSAHVGDLEFTEEQINKYKPLFNVCFQTTMPFKISPQKQELLEFIYNNREDENIKPFLKTRIEWYFDAQERLKEKSQEEFVQDKNNQTSDELLRIKELGKELREKIEREKQVKKDIKSVKKESRVFKYKVKENKTKKKNLVVKEYDSEELEEKQIIIREIKALKQKIELEKEKRKILKLEKANLKEERKKLKQEIEQIRNELLDAIDEIEI